MAHVLTDFHQHILVFKNSKICSYYFISNWPHRNHSLKYPSPIAEQYGLIWEGLKNRCYLSNPRTWVKMDLISTTTPPHI